MSLDQLEKLAKNPFYKLSPKQLKRLEELRDQNYRNNFTFKKHSVKPNNEPKQSNRS